MPLKLLHLYCQIRFKDILFFLCAFNHDSLSPILFNLALQKVIQSTQKVPSGIKIGKEQLNILAYADDIVLIGENEIEIRQLFVEMENIARKLGLQINQEKTKYRVSQEEWIKLREGVPYVKLYRYNPEHLYPKLNGYGDNGQRSLKL